MTTTFIPFYTPSLIPPEQLTQLFVGRERLLQQLIDFIRESAETPAKHYTVLIGPRGIGKTTLVTLVQHAVTHDPALAERLCVAWLREDEWGISSYTDWLLAVLNALQEQSPTLRDAIAALYDDDVTTVTRRAEQLILDSLQGRTLLVLMENLDRIFEGLGRDGQHQLRAFLQNSSACTMLATVPALFSAISLRTSPFYGFFRLYHLEALTLEDAGELLRKYAELHGNTALAESIATPQGQGRVRAIHLLTGGNHRVFTILAQCLTLEKFRTLVEAMLHIIDELTPYYQSRMEQLPQQQRKIVELLAAHGAPLPPKEVARYGFMSQQTAAKQLNELRDKGFVKPNETGRETWYELKEPLLRLCVEVKKSRGGNQPIRLIVEFLKHWYSPEELIAWMRSDKLSSDLTTYITSALNETHAESVHEGDIAEAASQQIFDRLEHSEYATALHEAKELLVYNDCALARGAYISCLLQLAQYGNALAASEEALTRYPDDIILLRLRAVTLGYLQRHDDAIAIYKKIIDIAPTSAHDWYGLGASLLSIWHTTDALAAFERAMEYGMKESWLGIGSAQLHLCHIPEALHAFRNAGAVLGEKVFDSIVDQPLHTIPAVLSPMVSDEAAESYLTGWRDLVGEREAFVIPLRVLAAAVEYRKAQNDRDRERALLKLPIEQRMVLQEIIKKAHENHAG